MIGFYLALPFAIAAFLRLLVAAFNYFSRPILPNGEPQVSPLVSVLIPARNEENTIGRLLSDLQGQTYQNLEVIVYNDQSTDKTLQVINEHSLKDRRVRAINGISLPEGWIGKNHACHCLAQMLRESILYSSMRMSALVINLLRMGCITC
jgi:chlorobactene glucosyltransferase